MESNVERHTYSRRAQAQSGDIVATSVNRDHCVSESWSLAPNVRESLHPAPTHALSHPGHFIHAQVAPSMPSLIECCVVIDTLYSEPVRADSGHEVTDKRRAQHAEIAGIAGSFGEDEGELFADVINSVIPALLGGAGIVGCAGGVFGDILGGVASKERAGERDACC